MQTIRLISGDDEVKALAEGLTDAIGDALGHQTALTVKSGDPAGADFVLKGSVQAAGKRLRLSFGLEEGASATQVWTQRYDRQLDDVFGLQDEIVLHVAAAIRIRIKAQLFERLRAADNATLAVPQLLDKAAGIFHPLARPERRGRATLRLAVERAPENSMALAMLGFGLFRVADYQATAMRPGTRDEILATLDRAIVLDPRSYFSARHTRPSPCRTCWATRVARASRRAKPEAQCQLRSGQGHAGYRGDPSRQRRRRHAPPAGGDGRQALRTPIITVIAASSPSPICWLATLSRPCG